MIPRRRLWRWKTAFVLAGLLVACLMLEVGLRVVSALEARRARTADARQQEPGPEGATREYWAIYDPDLGYRLNPRFGDHNADGLRDHPVGPKGSRFRLLFLGDSVAMYGANVDDTFVGHLRAELRAAAGSDRVDVINAGIKGFTNYQELLYLKKYGVAFEPDLVGVQFCLNDLHRVLHGFVIRDGEIVFGTYGFSKEAQAQARALRATRPAPPAKGWLAGVAERSRLVTFVRDRLPVTRQTVAWKTSGGFSFDYRLDIANAWREDDWPAIETQLREMVELGRRRRFAVFVVALPVATQYDPAYLARDRAYVLKPQRKLKEICERLGIAFYDLYPDLDASMFVRDAIHLTGAGRRLVGGRIARFLMDSRIVSDRALRPGNGS